jgi:hypothetical protein
MLSLQILGDPFLPFGFLWDSISQDFGMPRAVSERFLREIRAIPPQESEKDFLGGGFGFLSPSPLRNFTADLLVGLGPSFPIS